MSIVPLLVPPCFGSVVGSFIWLSCYFNLWGSYRCYSAPSSQRGGRGNRDILVMVCERIRMPLAMFVPTSVSSLLVIKYAMG